MNKLEEFYLDIYYAKQKWLAIQTNLEKPVFDIETEYRISAMSNLFDNKIEVRSDSFAMLRF